MPFSADFLHAMTQQQVLGDFAPFALGDEHKTEQYIRKIVAELQRNRHWLVAADFNHNGSGYASYVEITIAQKDQSDAVAPAKNGLVTYDFTGLRLYVSRLAPYWFYGGSEWSATFDNGRYRSGGHIMLEPAHHATIDLARWQADCYRLEAIFTNFRYGLLTVEELEQPAPVSIAYIPTVLADPPYRVFDCFFYWLD